ncbi:hypothetical protein [Paenibacillus sp. 1P03SA]|uniref:hypothetical protein n=1 Tax=Paenibacillus sp. 1P03SA TaxID=3132294 RepID=UPI0039A0CEAE
MEFRNVEVSLAGLMNWKNRFLSAAQQRYVNLVENYGIKCKLFGPKIRHRFVRYLGVLL